MTRIRKAFRQLDQFTAAFEPWFLDAKHFNR